MGTEAARRRAAVKAPLRRAQAAALALCVFLAIWGAKLAVIDRFGTDLPFWDQWAKEGELFLAPYFEHGEFWKNLFTPHNEHRIAPTLALNLGLVLAGGQWDARVQCMASGALHAALLAGLLFWAARRLAGGRAFGLAVLVTTLGAAPITWENLLSGFQSQFYFLAGFSLLALGGVLLHRAFSRAWWGGLAAGALAIVSMGSGLLCVAPIAVVALLRARARESRREAFAALAAAAVLAALGAWLHTAAPWHATLRAHSAGEFLVYLARCLAWPWVWWPWLAVVFWAPWVIAMGAHVRRTRAEATDDFLLAGGLWVGAQAAAAAYSRGAGGALPASRYGDLFALGLVFSAVALLRCGGRAAHAADGPRRASADAAQGHDAPPRRTGWRVITGAWFCVVGVFVVLAARESWRGPLPDKKADHVAYERNVQAFVLTDDFATFEKQTLPFPLPDWLARVLRRPAIRAVLPASVRAPLAVPGWETTPPLAPVPPLAHRVTHTLATAGEWRSPPLPAGRGWWKIETAGHLGEPGATLEVVSAASGRVLGSIVPSRPAGATWRAAYIPAPREPAVLRARVESAAHWIAFSTPIEMATLSYRAWVLAKYGLWIALAGGLGLAALWWQARRSEGAAPPRPGIGGSAPR